MIANISREVDILSIIVFHYPCFLYSGGTHLEEGYWNTVNRVNMKKTNAATGKTSYMMVNIAVVLDNLAAV